MEKANEINHIKIRKAGGSFMWIIENAHTLIVLGVVVLLVVLAVISVIKDRKKGRCSCGNSCAGCPMSSACHKKK